MAERGLFTDLAGRVAVVTGGASGLGAALAQRAARAGMRVLIADRDGPGLEAVRAELAGGGAEVRTRTVDVSRGAEVEALADAAFGELGGCHLLFNNAGVITSGHLWRQTEDDWRRVLDVNLWGVIHGLRAFVPRLIERGQEACVVNTASIGGLLSRPFVAPYVVSKFGVVALSEALRAELQAAGSPVRAAVLCPSAMATPLASRLGGGEGVERSAAEGLRTGIEAGVPPSEVAEFAFAGLAARRFWLLPHAGFGEAVTARAAEIAAAFEPL